MTGTVVITGVGLACGGLGDPSDLLDPAARATAEFDPAARLGRKGLRYKDRATALALAASLDALTDAGLFADGSLRVAGETLGVVASSNLGNLETVCAVVDTIAAETVTGTSPMDLPNASSNVVSSSVAIRFGLRGPNLMLCNGPTSGLDAMHWAANLITGGRCGGVVVVGVEVANVAVRRVVDDPTGALFDGAAAVVVESAERAAARGAPSLGELAGYHRGARHDVTSTATAGTGTGTGTAGTATGGQLWFTEAVSGVVHGHDLTAVTGAASGALGVLACVAATAWLSGNPGSVLATAGTPSDDAVAALTVTAPSAPRAE